MAYISRGRDIRMLFSKHGFDERTQRKAFEMLAEDNVVLQQEIADLRKVLGGAIIMMQNLGVAMEGMHGAMAEIEKKYRPNSEAHDDAGA